MTAHAIRKQKAIEDAFPIRIKFNIPPNGLGNRIHDIHTWLADNVGEGMYNHAPIKGAAAYYFRDIHDAVAFLAEFSDLDLEDKVEQMGLG